MSQLAQRLIMAAGGGKKESTYVEDVFSTYLYQGNNKSITVGNNLKLSDANAGFGVEFHSGDPDGIVTSGSDNFAFGTGDFTAEHWIYTDFAGTQQIIDARGWGASGDSNWSTSITSSNEYRLFALGAVRITSNTTLNTNTWYHIALVRSSGTTKLYIDGVQQATVMIGAGLTYKFDQSDGTNGNHPLRFSSDSGNSTPYTTGVTTSGVPGNAGAYTQIEVAAGAPSTLYYYCTNHSGMGGEANTDGWGRSYFGQADWGDTNIITQGWGRNSWGYQSWGDTPILTLTGLTATTSLGVPNELIEIKPGWGTLNWGENGWGSVESAVENLVNLASGKN